MLFGALRSPLRRSSSGALCWTVVLLGALWFVSILAGRGQRKPQAVPETKPQD